MTRVVQAESIYDDGTDDEEIDDEDLEVVEDQVSFCTVVLLLEKHIVIHMCSIGC